MDPSSSPTQEALSQFEAAVGSALGSFLRKGLTIHEAEFEVLQQLSAPGNPSPIPESEVWSFIEKGYLKRNDAIRAVVVHREIEALRNRGNSTLQAIEELTRRIVGREAAPLNSAPDLVDRGERRYTRSKARRTKTPDVAGKRLRKESKESQTRFSKRKKSTTPQKKLP